MNSEIQTLSSSASAKQWKKIGLTKRAGLMTPLFSIFTQDSIGIGDFNDLIQAGRACKKMGGSILQLLPINDSGFSFMPYDAQSSFALDPLYLPLTDLKDVDNRCFAPEVAHLKSLFPIDPYRVNYDIKAKKMELLWKIYRSSQDVLQTPGFMNYRKDNQYWIKDYALFKVLQHVSGEHDWQRWEDCYRMRDSAALDRLAREHKESIMFHEWIQYLCFEKMKSVKMKLNEIGVFLMGDLPFLVSKSSADVWAFPKCFKLHLSSGAPPDYFLAAGQRWGMPPYDWSELERDGYRYFKSKLRYAECFYDMYRIDHAIGFFRVWTIDNAEPNESAGKNGVYDPPDESVWQAHGEKLFRMTLDASEMLPCAEDLGTVPPCSEPTLAKLGIPGMEVHRWTVEEDHQLSTKDQYRAIASAVLSTHDTLPISQWWKSLSDEERVRYSAHLGISNHDPSYSEVLQKAFEFISATKSIFVIHSIQDVLNYTSPETQDHCMKNINYPGTFSAMNWSWRCPIPIDQWSKNEKLEDLKRMSIKSGRI